MNRPASSYKKTIGRRGEELAQHRRAIAQDFYTSLYREVSTGYASGREELTRLLGNG